MLAGIPAPGLVISFISIWLVAVVEVRAGADVAAVIWPCVVVLAPVPRSPLASHPQHNTFAFMIAHVSYSPTYMDVTEVDVYPDMLTGLDVVPVGSCVPFPSCP